LLLPSTTFYESNDISVHYDLNTGTLVANTLGDLTKRECRYGHAFINSVPLSNGFPHRIVPGYLLPFGGILNSGNYSVANSNSRYGEDVVLTNVVSFDVQAWDPTAPVYTTATTPSVAVSPSDVGFPYPPSAARTIANLGGTVGNPASQPTSIGAFADLNWLKLTWSGSPVSVPWSTVPSPSTMSPFYSTGHPKSQLVASSPTIGSATPVSFTQNWLFDDGTNGSGLPNYSRFSYIPATYDTWSTHYEHDGLDQDLALGDTNGPDQGGLAIAGPETSPPYPAPLRGIKITLRCYEPDSRQMHEISVVESFVPE
jgi:hypothetical protein